MRSATTPPTTSYAFERGFPVPDTAQRVHDEEDFERAVQAYKFFYPTISQEGIFQGMRDLGLQDNHGALLFACGPKNVLFTANVRYEPAEGGEQPAVLGKAAQGPSGGNLQVECAATRAAETVLVSHGVRLKNALDDSNRPEQGGVEVAD